MPAQHAVDPTDRYAVQPDDRLCRRSSPSLASDDRLCWRSSPHLAPGDAASGERSALDRFAQLGR
ncbi:hypothetical protein [Nonomuraea gerenzanensis]|uniref:Uncharacterized protein n=1 Tax=Nonomuraea gerenzanensis TaxID=93944 RepID=A0A1M4EFV8_9ACTN|nr:hypothetical protein [Nonomuraea gerenzanensis]UBU09281.1 hypothetical protein LCN96_33515 [Nonomuraea gerenzanensis]SBO97682.1 hypothetical protein BN4615_P7198 [Nonomuraea gerenzanensis]